MSPASPRGLRLSRYLPARTPLALWGRRAGLAVLVVLLPAAAALLGDSLGAATHTPAPLLPAAAAVVLVASFGGLRAGLVATVVAIGVHLFAPRLGSAASQSTPDAMRIMLFALTGILASTLAWLRSRAERRATLVALEAGRVRDRSEIAARRLEALQVLTTELAGAGATDRVLAVVLDQARRSLKGDELVAWAIDHERGQAVVVASLVDGLAGSLVGTRISLGSRWPAAEAGRLERPVFAEDPCPEDPPPGMLRFSTAAAVPMPFEDGAPGVLAIGWTAPTRLPTDRREFIQTLARAGSMALERRALVTAEVDARQQAEAVTRHLHVLADAGRALGTTLDPDAMLRRLPGLGVPHLGDVALVEITLDSYQRRLAAPGHESLHAIAVALRRGAEPGAARTGGRDGGSTAVRADAALRASLARTPEEAAALEQLDPTWALLVPLRGQSGGLGRIVLLRREDRPFTAEEVTVGDELGDRASRAIENARMHRELVAMARHEKRRAVELEAVLAAVEDGFVLTDADGRIRSVNAAAVALLGEAGTLPELLDRVVDAGGHRPELRPGHPVEVRRAADQATWLEIILYEAAMPDEEDLPSSVLVVRDVTAFRRVRALQEAFLGLLSHELRTPVTTIYAGAALLARRDRKLDRATAEDVLADMAGEADRLYRLVEDLMVLARFDSSFSLGDQPVLLHRVVATVVDQERGRWPAVRLAVIGDPSLPAVAGDETAITQVIRNLVSNAAKYSPPGASVTLVTSRANDGERLLVEVRDEGPGIAASEVERVFDPFYRSPSTAGLAGGAGIGLFVSRRLAEAMGGSLIALPTPSGARGARLRLLLPVYAAVDADEAEMTPVG